MITSTDWSRCIDYLADAMTVVDPMDSTETAFFFVRLSELVDVARSQLDKIRIARDFENVSKK